MLMPALLGLSRADVASQEEGAGAIRGCRLSAMPGNVVHAGGLLQDATLNRQTPLIARAVFAPKHAGATNLLRVCAALLCHGAHAPWLLCVTSSHHCLYPCWRSLRTCDLVVA